MIILILIVLQVHRGGASAPSHQSGHRRYRPSMDYNDINSNNNDDNTNNIINDDNNNDNDNDNDNDSNNNHINI